MQVAQSVPRVDVLRHTESPPTSYITPSLKLDRSSVSILSSPTPCRFLLLFTSIPVHPRIVRPQPWYPTHVGKGWKGGERDGTTMDRWVTTQDPLLPRGQGSSVISPFLIFPTPIVQVSLSPGPVRDAVVFRRTVTPGKEPRIPERFLGRGGDRRL